MEGLFDDPRLSPAERAAVRFADQMWHDHTSMPADVWADLEAHFCEQEIIELGFAVANYIGMGQFAAMLGMP